MRWIQGFVVNRSWFKVHPAALIVLPLAIISFFLLCPPALTQMLPTLPQVTLPTAMPAITGNTYIVSTGGNLQAAINQAAAANPSLNHLISLPAEATFTGPFTLPARAAGTGWVIIRSSAIGSLPEEGRRVKPSDAPNMPKIVVSAGRGGAIRTASQARHFRFVGIEFRPVTNNLVYSLVDLGSGETSPADLPHDIIFDRCYLHGDPNRGARRGIALNAARVAVIDSYLSAFAKVGADSQAIAGWNGPGPFKILNNYLEGAGANVIFGGADPSIPNLVPADIQIRRNHFFKPLTWKADDPSYGGIPWSVKNLLELKNARRVLIEGNIFEHNWADAQTGFAILFTVGNQDGTAPWSTVEDVTFRRNIVRHTGSGVNILGEDDLYPSQQTRRILIQDNLFDDVNGRKWGGDGRIFQIVTPNRPTVDLTIDHNTALHVGGGNGFVAAGDTPAVAQNLVFRNNIVTRGDCGLFGSGLGEGLPTLQYHFPGYVFQKNVIIGGGNVSDYPPDNFFPVAVSNVGFVNHGGDDYRLHSASPYKRAAAEGKDIGADILALDRATAGVRQGTPDPSPPSVSITAPVDGAIVSGSSVTISAEASDDVGVAGVQFMLDGMEFGPELTTPPYNISWNTTKASNDVHVLMAVARDAAGNTTTSSPISVTVSNPSGGGTDFGWSCFISSVVAGSPFEEHVGLLRTFRDQYLLTNRAGRVLVQWYYRVCPVVAAEIRESPSLKALVRAFLWPGLVVVWLLLHPWVGFGLLLGAGSVLIIWRRF